ncbi:MAG: SpoIIE family protein phosphatase [Clostridia bacterium]|nr:SpoIIE family protein phosphatase [Clostridia bacterium]
MKRVKNMVIGGIQSKIINLILLTVVLLTAAFMAVTLFHSNMLAQLSSDSSARQQTAITDTTTEVMDQMISQTLSRSNRVEAGIADRMFEEVRNQVTFLATCVENLLAHPQDYAAKPYAEPDPADDGVWKAKVIYADGVDASDPAIAAKIGLLANLSDSMAAMCTSFEAANAYIALPEGVHLSMSDTSSSWFADGKRRSYDPRTRGWYQQAAEAGSLIFTEGEWDANTGAYCIECAMPAYGPDGSLQAVIGMDLYLNEMQAIMQDSEMEGEYGLLVNHAGYAVLAPLAEAFPMSEADRTGDLRESSNLFLKKVVSDALEGSDTGIMLGELSDGMYYVTGTPIETTGWVLISAFSQTVSNRGTVLLTERFSSIQNDAVADYQAKTRKCQTTAIILLVAVMALTLFWALVVGRRIVKPLNTITRHVSELSDGNLEFKMEDAYRTGDEVEELAKSFASLSQKTLDYMDRIVKVTAEKERIGAELSLATKIQADMLPHIFPAFPDRPDFDVFATMDPAKEVGGDFYDYFLIDDDHLCMVIADVSGKGVPAALFMMASKIILQNVAMMGNSPAAILARANAALCSNNEAQMFVTVWLGILELSTGKLTAANAGHEYPMLKKPDGAFEVYKDKHGFVIGGLEGARYREYELTLEPGAKLFVYTDGVPEATNGEMELFGTDRMIEALNTHPEAAPFDILKNMRAAVDDFVKDAEQFDDLTMLCMEYRGLASQKGEGK